MRLFSYRAVFESGDETGVVVTFPDVPEAITQGDDAAEAREMASDALGVALLGYVEAGRPLPLGTLLEGPDVIHVAPEVAAKLALVSAFAASTLSKSALARHLGKDEKEVRRLLDPGHSSKVGPLAEALAALGERLVVSATRRAPADASDAVGVAD